ncbi:MAG: hypothetical protein HN580_22875 [Deltaproteobacteria bacterium]|jgi:hypothetical protein|nr:hypothetical protein [Deltaproteobacteria bacterium]MBT4266339.1 hypothetical protein [Deltaproteobacteria bacterium]MBT6502563.1 hypothetical protein [Deltaproteobacteria bacterium]MBT6612448.1 hypothetical protein [Deltaproteobacteria bacterium]MBT7154879.1 hypothetical protein [Deltaproteobacteria bacterium]
MKLDWKKSLGLVFLFFLLFNGCQSVDEKTDCVYYLNQKDYSRVAADTSCSTYERASAEVGLAGFQFSSFLDGDASENFRQALGISSSVTAWTTWAGKTHYENAMKLSGDSTGDTYEGQTRLKEDVEIHYFSTLGAIMALTYIEMDANSDGDVSETEIQSFTGIRASNDASYGTNKIQSAEWFEFVTDKGSGSEKVFVLNTTTGKCALKTTPKYDGLWPATSYDLTDTANCGVVDSTTLAAWAVAGEGTIGGQCAAIMKIEELQNLFLPSSGGSLSVLDLTQYFVTYVSSIDHDMVDLGIPEDSDLRKGLSEFSANIDNGATCSNDTLTEVDQIFSILEVAAVNSATDYENINVLPFSTISSASDTAVALTDFATVIETGGNPVTVTFTCNNSANMSARMIFKQAATYIPYYSGADANINDTFSSLNVLNSDAAGSVKPTSAGDKIVSFKELLCME